MDTPLRILVAEDDAADALLLKRAFAKARVNLPIYFARDGQQVMDYLLGNPPFDNPVEFPLPNLLLLDLKLPRVSGFAVLEWLRNYPGLNRLLVVVFSASGSSEDVTRAYALGANAYIMKLRWLILRRLFHRVLAVVSLAPNLAADRLGKVPAKLTQSVLRAAMDERQVFSLRNRCRHWELEL